MSVFETGRGKETDSVSMERRWWLDEYEIVESGGASGLWEFGPLGSGACFEARREENRCGGACLSD